MAERDAEAIIGYESFASLVIVFLDGLQCCVLEIHDVCLLFSTRCFVIAFLVVIVMGVCD